MAWSSMTETLARGNSFGSQHLSSLEFREVGTENSNPLITGMGPLASLVGGSKSHLINITRDTCVLSSGYFESFRTSVPESRTKTKYASITINHTITGGEVAVLSWSYLVALCAQSWH